MSARRRRGLPPPRHVSAATADLRPPPALTHGLTSRRLRDAMRGHVEALTTALIGGAYPNPPAINAARSAAEAILHLDQVRRARRAVIEDLRRQPARFRGSEFKLFRALEQILDGKFRPDSEDEPDQVIAYLGDTDADDDPNIAEAGTILASIMAQKPKELRRMAEYERKAVSLRAKTLRRLALELIEAERRRHSDVRAR